MHGVVLFLHGSGDHCRRYVFLYEHLCEAGYGVIAYDMVNHGASHCDSSKTRGHVRSFRHLVEDTNAFVTFAKQIIFPQVKALSGSQSPPLVRPLARCSACIRCCRVPTSSRPRSGAGPPSAWRCRWRGSCRRRSSRRCRCLCRLCGLWRRWTTRCCGVIPPT